jgi:hypothetical protein
LASRPSADSTLLAAVAAFTALLVTAAVYLPDIGRGFVKDDFRWIRDARAAIAEPSASIFPAMPDFYRPLVTWTFAADYRVHGLTARGYGFTNLGLFLACAIVVWMVLLEAGLTFAGASVGAFAWAMNPHGIAMAIVWLSGRTSLLLTLCATLSALAFLRRQRTIGAVMLFAALLSKEEATLLPFVLFLWLRVLRRGERRDVWLDAVAVAMPLAVYALLRLNTSALMPSTAPWFYRPATSVAVLATNALQYLDRSLTFPAAIALVAWAIYRRMPSVPTRMVAAGAAWLAGGYALTVWVPVRSSLYAVFPSVGSALLCGAAIDALRSARVDTPRLDRWFAAALASYLAFVPVLQSRNDRWVEPARLSARTLQTIVAQPPDASATGVVVLQDEEAPFACFADAFGALAPLAVEQATQVRYDVRVVLPGEPRIDAPIAARYTLTHGRVDRVE